MMQQVSQLMEAEGLDEKDALKRVARERGVSKSEVYRELQRERPKKIELSQSPADRRDLARIARKTVR